MITGSPTFEHLIAAGRQLVGLSRSARWALGDLISYAKRQRRWGNRYEDAVEALRIEPGYARQLSMTAEAFSPDRRDRQVPWSHFRDLAAFSPDIQDRLLALAVEQQWTSVELRAHIREIRHQERLAGREWPTGKFGIIVADPPWKATSDGSSRAPENHYPTLPLEEIVALGPQVLERAADDAVLYLWATSPLLKEALSIIEAWGFVYVTNMVWVKDLMGLGCWARQRHELVLIATRGHPVPPAENDRPDSVIVGPRRDHSQKPEEFAEVIDRIYPDVPKLELFARTARPGWAAWGNEALADGHDHPLG